MSKTNRIKKPDTNKSFVLRPAVERHTHLSDEHKRQSSPDSSLTNNDWRWARVGLLTQFNVWTSASNLINNLMVLNVSQKNVNWIVVKRIHLRKGSIVWSALLFRLHFFVCRCSSRRVSEIWCQISFNVRRQWPDLGLDDYSNRINRCTGSTYCMVERLRHRRKCEKVTANRCCPSGDSYLSTMA